jgi:hypothetical protein
MPKTVPFYGQEGCSCKNFLPIKVKNRWSFALRVGSYADMAEKKSRKIPKKLDKKSTVRYTVLVRDANTFHFIQSLLSVEACPPDAQLV